MQHIADTPDVGRHHRASRHHGLENCKRHPFGETREAEYVRLAVYGGAVLRTAELNVPLEFQALHQVHAVPIVCGISHFSHDAHANIRYVREYEGARPDQSLDSLNGRYASHTEYRGTGLWTRRSGIISRGIGSVRYNG
jgi:hypothetical protein